MRLGQAQRRQREQKRKAQDADHSRRHEPGERPVFLKAKAIDKRQRSFGPREWARIRFVVPLFPAIAGFSNRNPRACAQGIAPMMMGHQDRKEGHQCHLEWSQKSTRAEGPAPDFPWPPPPRKGCWLKRNEA